MYNQESTEQIADQIILIAGPDSKVGSRVYGGGVGGYTRNLSTYLCSLSVSGVTMKPLHLTVRGYGGIVAGNPVARLVRDINSLLVACFRERPRMVHVLAQYRGALPREFAMAIVCRALGVGFIYDIKAGAFETSYENSSWIYRLMVRTVVKLSNIVFVEGKRTKRFVEKKLGKETIFFPNFVPHEEVPTSSAHLFSSDHIRVLFVGYCYRGKGVYELVEACHKAARPDIRIELKLVGEESSEFQSWMDGLPPIDNLDITRHGRVPHENVLDLMQSADIYVYPTSHPGEGHNNSINEAMMYGLVIISTKKGFLADVLKPNCAHFLDSGSSEEIAATLSTIVAAKDDARQMAGRARARLMEEFTSKRASVRYANAYRSAIGTSSEVDGSR